MNTRSNSWGKGGRCVGLTIFPPSCADCLAGLGASTSWSPMGLSRPVQGWLYSILRCWSLLCFIYFDPLDVSVLRACTLARWTLPFRCLLVCSAAQYAEHSARLCDNTAVGECLQACERILEVCVNHSHIEVWTLKSLIWYGVVSGFTDQKKC
jgi:hypothetical protein